MTYYIVIFSGLLALLYILFLGQDEERRRHKRYTRQLHTQLILLDVPGESAPLSCSLYRVNTVLGRRKRRSDINLSVYNDPTISKKHATLVYNGTDFVIYPEYRPSGRRYSEILVERKPVPPEGTVVRYGDRISISGHIMLLEDSRNTETKGGN